MEAQSSFSNRRTGSSFIAFSTPPVSAKQQRDMTIHQAWEEPLT
jgi:hypothetical protein